MRKITLAAGAARWPAPPPASAGRRLAASQPRPRGPALAAAAGGLRPVADPRRRRPARRPDRPHQGQGRLRGRRREELGGRGARPRRGHLPRLRHRLRGVGGRRSELRQHRLRLGHDRLSERRRAVPEPALRGADLGRERRAGGLLPRATMHHDDRNVHRRGNPVSAPRRAPRLLRHEPGGHGAVAAEPRARHHQLRRPGARRRRPLQDRRAGRRQGDDLHPHPVHRRDVPLPGGGAALGRHRQ